MKIFPILCFLFSWLSLSAFSRDTLDISGSWYYRLSNVPSHVPGEGYISLPNTLDNARKSVYNPETLETDQLRREFSFAGTATYSKDIQIPEDWAGDHIELWLERSRPSSVTFDGIPVAFDLKVSSPQRFNLTPLISPGNHTISISVNNLDSVPAQISRDSHSFSESTQTNWNGILGEMLIIRKNPFHITSVSIDEKQDKDDIIFGLNFSRRTHDKLKIGLEINGENVIWEKIPEGTDSISFRLPKKNVKLWSASTPNLYDVTFLVTDSAGKEIDSYSFTTGFREFTSSGNQFLINGNPEFLRGTVNAAVFPLTAAPPMDLKSWQEYFSTIKEYGLNHVRFHSWTPPEAAFLAADREGVYLMVELPLWGDLDKASETKNRFLKEDLKGIMEAYRHHPSLILFSPGNELWGDINIMGEFMTLAKVLNPRILSTYGTNVYMGMYGQIGDEDFIVSAKTTDSIQSSLRGSNSFAESITGGYFNSTTPSGDSHFPIDTTKIHVPVISHEVGQYQSYPDFREIELYTGNLKPDNLKAFQKNSRESGTLRKSQKFLEASGKWGAALYKAEMEMALRTPGLAGFEIFGLQDYPGQGTAMIGILNPFMKSKDFITPKKWRQSSDTVVILAEMPKFTFYEGEEVRIPIKIANYGISPLPFERLNWNTKFAKGIFTLPEGKGIVGVDTIRFQIPKISEPAKMQLKLSGIDNEIYNVYDFWVYPSKVTPVKNVLITSDISEAIDYLNRGERVILCPEHSSILQTSLPPLFTTDFWNYRLYNSVCEEMGIPSSPGTLGLLIDETHPVFNKFPTENHTQWHWFSIVNNSRTLIIDRLPGEIDPIIEVIDNPERSYRLALMLECNVSKGKLLILTVDLQKIEETPEGFWLMQSVKEYVAGKEFNPSLTLTPLQVENLLTKPSTARKVKEMEVKGWKRTEN
ncbi:MAG: hypothetical protein J1F16_04700 [Muribaculaceae bacterium]|nr:hypothetical protein [Muribaculaceae bacterium]